MPVGRSSEGSCAAGAISFCGAAGSLPCSFAGIASRIALGLNGIQAGRVQGRQDAGGEPEQVDADKVTVAGNRVGRHFDGGDRRQFRDARGDSTAAVVEIPPENASSLHRKALTRCDYSRGRLQSRNVGVPYMQNARASLPRTESSRWRAAAPLLDPHYQASALVWAAPTSEHHRPCPRFFHLFTGTRTDARISVVTTCSRCRARYWARGARLPRQDSHPLEHATLPGQTNPFLCYHTDKGTITDAL